MQDSISQIIQKSTQAFIEAVSLPSTNIATIFSSTLNQFLTWPFRIGPVLMTDLDGKTVNFEVAIYSSSTTASGSPPTKVKADEVACGFHIVKNLGLEELRAGYEKIALMKRLKRKMPEIDYPLNTTPLGIILAVESDISQEKIADRMTDLNKKYPSSEWPDMVVILTRGTINYVMQIHGEPIKGNFLLPSKLGSAILPMYIHMIMHGLGLFSMNKLLGLLFMHLQTFSPGINLPDTNEILKDVSNLGITIGAYQYNLSGQLIPLPYEQRLNQAFQEPHPFRIEDTKGNLLSHLYFIFWQDGGVVRLVGKLPLESVLIFLGIDLKHAQIIKLSDGAISSVLPIQKKNFGEMLSRLQRQSNMKIKQEEPKLIVSKIADEGSSSPFMARMFMGIGRLRDVIFNDPTERGKFDETYRFVVDTLMNTRTTSKEIIEMLAEHRRKVSRGEIARLEKHIIHISENIDNKLRKHVEEFLNSSVRVCKDGMQRLSALLHMDIGFIFQKKSIFEKGIAGLSRTRPELIDYFLETRKWSERLIQIRNDLHEGWMLPRMGYKESSDGIQIIEPQILGQSVSEFVDYMLDRLCCFVEEISVYSLQTQMPLRISISEITISDRKANMPERFQITFVDSGEPIWKIVYHNSKFEET